MGREWATLTQDFPLSLLHIVANYTNGLRDSSKVATQLPSDRINIVKMLILPKAICRLNEISLKSNDMRHRTRRKNLSISRSTKGLKQLKLFSP